MDPIYFLGVLKTILGNKSCLKDDTLLAHGDLNYDLNCYFFKIILHKYFLQQYRFVVFLGGRQNSPLQCFCQKLSLSHIVLVYFLLLTAVKNGR